MKSTPTSDWRSLIKVHPAADLFPLMSPEDLRVLGEDIKANGLNLPIDLFSTELDGEYLVLDGRNRLDAMELIGWHFEYDKASGIQLKAIDPTGAERSEIWGIPNFESLKAEAYQSDPIHFDPYTYVVSANMNRRHLTTEQRKDSPQSC